MKNSIKDKVDKDLNLNNLEKRLLLKALNTTSSIKNARLALGVSEATIHRLINKHKVKKIYISQGTNYEEDINYTADDDSKS